MILGSITPGQLLDRLNHTAQYNLTDLINRPMVISPALIQFAHVKSLAKWNS